MSATEPSPAVLSRTTGALFLVMAAGGIFGAMVVRASMVVAGDAAATADNVLASETLFRLGMLGDLTAFALDVPVAILLYVLLRPAGKTLALLGAAFRLVYTAVVGANLVNHFAALMLLKAGASMSAFEPAQLEQLALHTLDVHAHGYALALVFFAVHLVLLGVAMWRSEAFARWLGVLMVIAGAAYLFDSVALFVAPALQAAVNPVLALPMSFELVLAVWMLVRGVRREAVVI